MMRQQRHPHPHVDPRQPRDGVSCGTNPPVFAWKPPAGAEQFGLVVARDEALGSVVLERAGLSEPVFLPEEAFPPGRYFWQWSAGDDAAEVFSFDISESAAVVEVPSAQSWLESLPASHPRVYIRPEGVEALRKSGSGVRSEMWRVLGSDADALLAEPHEMAEPPFLPDRRVDYQAMFDLWRKIMVDSRGFVGGAQTLALAYLAGGDKRYARAACERLDSISRWDPDGSSHLSHNDEAHMSVIWDGPSACDWVWDQFTDAQRRRVIDQFRRRGQITFEYMHNRGSYGVSRFNSHAGREIVFLAQLAMVFHEHIPEAGQWLAWLRPVLCGIWPIWAGDDGAWAEGPVYGLTYVRIMTQFAVTLKAGADVDLFRRPFWPGHARWRRWCFPPYAQWVGFGDQNGRRAGIWRRNADLVELIDSQTGGAGGGYVEAFRIEAELIPSGSHGRKNDNIWSQRYLGASLAPPIGPEAGDEAVLAVFPAAGWAAVRTAIDDPARDVAMIFRSSPYGAISHSHANNNDFILHVAGQVLAMPAGHYDGYGSAHHTHYVWHTRSHNCVTLSEAGQLMRSPDSAGRIENNFEDERLAYFRGNADASYADRADRCRRHVVFLKAHNCFVMIDEFVARSGVASGLQWNIHSWAEFAVDQEGRRFELERQGSRLVGHFLYHHNSFFTLGQGWDPPPMQGPGKEPPRDQHHLRFSTAGLAERRNLGVVLCPSHAGLAPADVHAERVGETELARIGQDTVLVNSGAGIRHEDVESDALAVLIVDGCRYEVSDAGIGV